MLVAAIDVGWAVLASGVGPTQHLDPGCCVTAQPSMKLGVLAPGGRDHGHEATAMAGDMGQVLVGAKLAIGYIEEVGAAGELAQALPGADVGRIVGGVPVVHVGEIRKGPSAVGGRMKSPRLGAGRETL